MSSKTLPPGIYPQLYRDANHGGTPAMVTALAKIKQHGCPGVFFHMFPNEANLIERFKACAKLAHDEGLLACVAFGLDSSMSPTAKGDALGAVAALPECYALALDAEGAWDSNKKSDAIVMCERIRELAPDALILDQPWPVPNYHSGFPWEEFSKYVDIHAPQYYYNDFKSRFGSQRYVKCQEWFDGSWTALENSLRAKNPSLVKTRIPTIQGYGWDDSFYDLVTCLMSNETALVWCDPFPTETFAKGLRVRNALTLAGHTGPRAVFDFQQANNLDVDGKCGPATLLALGVS